MIIIAIYAIAAIVLCILFLSSFIFGSKKEKINLKVDFEMELKLLEVNVNEGGRPFMIFLSESEKAYFKMYITSYEYNNMEIEKGGLIKFSVRDSKFGGVMKNYHLEWNERKRTLEEINYIIKNRNMNYQ